MPRVIGGFSATNIDQAITTDPRTGKVYFGNDDNSNVVVVDERSLHVTATLNGGTCCGEYTLSVNPATGAVYSSGIDDDTYIINGATHKVTDTGIGGYGAYYDSANNTTYLPDLYTYKVALFQHGALKPTAFRHIGTNANAEVGQIAFNTVTNKVYMVYLAAGAGQSSGVVVLDGKSNRAVAFLPVSYPSGVTVNSRTNRVYVSGGLTSTTVTVFDGGTNQAVAHVTFGGDTLGSIVVNPATNMLFMANFGNSNAGNSRPVFVTVLNGATNRVSESIPMPKSITGAMAIDTVTGKVFVANDQFVTVIK